PTATGTRTGTVTVTDSATGSPHKLSRSGSGVSSGTGTPAVSLSPTSLSFGNQTVGTASAAHVVTLKNTGTATLGISGITHTVGSFYFGPGGTCISTLAAGASCTFNVVFKPATTGTLTGTVTVTDNATGSPQKVGLTGSGVSSGTPAPGVSLSPSALSFGNQKVGTASAVKYVTLTNTGNATLTLSGGFLISGNFAFGGLGTCGSTVAPGANCTISVKFTPTAKGARTGAV